MSQPQSMQNLDSSFTITFIQLSTYHNCFCIAHFKLIFFCLCVSAGFYLAFLYVKVNPISFRQFTARSAGSGECTNCFSTEG